MCCQHFLHNHVSDHVLMPHPWHGTGMGLPPINGRCVAQYSSIHDFPHLSVVKRFIHWHVFLPSLMAV